MRQPRSKYDCIDRLKPDEPYFVLRGQDRLSAELVESWVIEAQLNGCPAAKVAEARAIAKAMRDWSGKKKMPD